MTVTVYTKPACPGCTATTRKLTALGVTFTERPAAAHIATLRDLGASQAPVVLIHDAGALAGWWSGYRPERLAALAGVMA